MHEPVLVVMAAGMGSRYGGLKQIDPIGENGEIIIDFSLFDALRAGFKKVVFVIKRELEADFRQVIGDRMSRHMEVAYAYQNLSDVPDGYSIPSGRTKPWGTGHAIRACREIIDAPFAVINADDYYGAQAFSLLYDFLKNANDDTLYRYAMVGYVLENTLTEHGHVARGVCTVTGDGLLETINERVRIEKHGDKSEYTEDDGKSWVEIPRGSTVSMNLWGFSPSILKELDAQFPAFLENDVLKNPEKAEFFLPSVVDRLVESGKATVRVLKSPDRWYGVTYREDKPVVVEALAKMRTDGAYPNHLWEEI